MIDPQPCESGHGRHCRHCRHCKDFDTIDELVEWQLTESPAALKHHAVRSSHPLMSYSLGRGWP